MPSSDRKVRIRSAVRRLLSGERSQHDLAILCLWLRSPKTPKKSLTTEIGDFIAHNEEREKGITFEAVEDFYRMWNGSKRHFHRHPSGKPNTPDSFNEHIAALRRRITQLPPESLLGLHPEAARQKIEQISKLAKFNDHIGVYFDPPLSADDRALFDEVIRWIKSTPAFDEVSLEREYREAMLENDVLRESEIEKWKSVIPFFSAYLLSTMHLTRIQMKDGTAAFLNMVVGAKDSKGKLQLWIQFNIDPKVTLHTPIFSSELKADEWCEPEVLQYKVEAIFPSSQAPWEEKRTVIPALELDDSGKIILSSTDVDWVFQNTSK